MKYLKSLFNKQIKKEEECLYRKINAEAYLEYEDNRNKESFLDSEKDQVRSLFRKSIFGENTDSFITISKEIPFLSTLPPNPFFQIQKYEDERFIVFVSKFTMKKFKIDFEVIEQYLCDTIEGVKNLIKKYYS